jgi:septum formation protein
MLDGVLIILGSSSKHRLSVFRKYEIPIYSQIDPDIDEKAIRDPDPKILTKLITEAKTEACLKKIIKQRLPDGIYFLICSDQVSVVSDEIREKPESQDELRKFLQSYSEGSLITTVTGLEVTRIELKEKKLATMTRLLKHHLAEVKFRPIPDEVIEEKSKEGSILYTCGGGFSVQHLAEYVDYVKNGEDSVTGMPIELLKTLIDQLSSIFIR